jgi:type IV pilus assembly protein PilO
MALGPKTQREQVLVAIGFVAVLLILPYWYYVYNPKSITLAELSSRVERLETANEKARTESKRGSVERLRQEAVAYQKNLEVMRQLVPTSNEVAPLLEQVSTAARRVGLDLAAVEPVPVIEGEQFDTYRYKVTVIGGYHALTEFLTNVGSLTRIIAPINLTMAPPQNERFAPGARRSSESKLECKFEIQTYVAKVGAARPAPQEKRS